MVRLPANPRALSVGRAMIYCLTALIALVVRPVSTAAPTAFPQQLWERSCGSTKFHDSASVEQNELRQMNSSLRQGIPYAETGWIAVAIAAQTAIVKRTSPAKYFGSLHQGEVQGLLQRWRAVYRLNHAGHDQDDFGSVVVLGRSGFRVNTILSEKC